MNDVHRHWLAQEYRPWLQFAKGYLKLASLCCQQWIDPRYEYSNQNPFVPKPFTEGYFKEDLLPGIFCCTKHGIELFLKSLLIGLEKPDRDEHNLDKLFQKARKFLEEINWQPITINESQSIMNEDEIKRLKGKVIGELERLIHYFFVNKFLNEKLGLNEIPDPNNIIFKYPDNKEGKKFFKAELYEKVTVEDIKEVRMKIMTLHRHFNDIGYLIVTDRRYQPRNQ